MNTTMNRPLDETVRQQLHSQRYSVELEAMRRRLSDPADLEKLDAAVFTAAELREAEDARDVLKAQEGPESFSPALKTAWEKSNSLLSQHVTNLDVVFALVAAEKIRRK